MVVRASVPPGAPEGPLDETWVESLQEGPAQLFVGDLEDAVVVSMPTTTSSASFQAAAKALQQAFPDRSCLIVTHAVHFLHAEPVNPVDARRLIEKIGEEEVDGAQEEQPKLGVDPADVPEEPEPAERAKMDALLKEANGQDGSGTPADSGEEGEKR